MNDDIHEAGLQDLRGNLAEEAAAGDDHGLARGDEETRPRQRRPVQGPEGPVVPAGGGEAGEGSGVNVLTYC